MKSSIKYAFSLCGALLLVLLTAAVPRVGHAQGTVTLERPKGPCDIYAAAGDPCVAAHSTTRALYAGYNGPLYQVMRQSDGAKLDINVVQPSAHPRPDMGGYADASAQDAFCAGTYCWITILYDQSPQHNDLSQAPRGGFSGPSLGGFNNLPLADMAPASVMSHKVYGVFIAPGMGLRRNDAKGTAVDDQAEGQYWVINGLHFNSGCCFDYGNAEIDSRDDDNGTMETTYFGNAPWWFHGNPPGPWMMTDQENNLVGCVNSDGSKLCAKLPDINWRFATGIAKGQPHHWTSLAGDAQRGPLQVMFDGPRVNATYDPMRKQGAILLGNGGDNSNGSQGTFYEGAMTASGTFPSDATDQLVQSNILAAQYRVAHLALLPSRAGSTAGALQIFSPGSTQESILEFTNTSSLPVSGVRLALTAPASEWRVVAADGRSTEANLSEPVAPGATVRAAFRVTSGPHPLNGDLAGTAIWTDPVTGERKQEQTVLKVRNTAPVKINEFSLGTGAAGEAKNSFIELYNAGTTPVDISKWSLTIHPAQQAIFSSIEIPGGTLLAAHGFYLLGLSNSGLSVPAHRGDSTIHVRTVTGMTAGDTITIGDGSQLEQRRIITVGGAAAIPTTVWQPLPEGPILTVPAGSTNIPVASVEGFAVGQKIALGYGSTYPTVARDLECYEVATVTFVGKAGTQGYLAEDVPAGAKNIHVTTVSEISAGDRIRLDIDTPGHGIETVTVVSVGTSAHQTNLHSPASAGASTLHVRNAQGFSVGGRVNVGTPASLESVTVTKIAQADANGTTIEIYPALAKSHIAEEWVVSLGTGLELAEPLRFAHAANLPFSDRGTGIGFVPATSYAHSSSEPVQALGTGIVLDRPLVHDHAVHDTVKDSAVKVAGYQGSAKPDIWFGGPELTTYSPTFGRMMPVRQGSLVLRDAAVRTVDSVNYGGLVDPWTAEGDQSISGLNRGGCYAPVASSPMGFGPAAVTSKASVSTGRVVDGDDTGSNCDDFLAQGVSSLALDAALNTDNIKVNRTDVFAKGQRVSIGEDDLREDAVIAEVGTAGASVITEATAVGVTTLSLANAFGLEEGQTIVIGSGQTREVAVITGVRGGRAARITLKAPLTASHAAGESVAGTGLTLAAPLRKAHAKGTTILNAVPTPGAANTFVRAAKQAAQ